MLLSGFTDFGEAIGPLMRAARLYVHLSIGSNCCMSLPSSAIADPIRFGSTPVFAAVSAVVIHDIVFSSKDRVVLSSLSRAACRLGNAKRIYAGHMIGRFCSRLHSLFRGERCLGKLTIWIALSSRENG